MPFWLSKAVPPARALPVAPRLVQPITAIMRMLSSRANPALCLHHQCFVLFLMLVFVVLAVIASHFERVRAINDMPADCLSSCTHQDRSLSSRLPHQARHYPATFCWIQLAFGNVWCIVAGLDARPDERAADLSHDGRRHPAGMYAIGGQR